MENSLKEKVYDQYVDDTVGRIKRFAPLIAIGELILTFLDFQSGFFNADSLNYINLAAEIMLIITGIAAYLICNKVFSKDGIKRSYKTAMIVGFRVIIMLAVLMFIYTDIYVRHEAFGAYMVFLFVLQLTPAYKASTNWIQFLVIGAMTVIMYLVFVANSMNILFSTLVVFACFAITTDYLRKYFTKQLESSHMAEYNNLRYRRLATQTINALAGAVEAKDMYTKGHSQRVSEYSVAIAQRMGYDEAKLKEVSFIALMHDVGKIGVSDSVINKTDRLTDEEFDQIKKHPEMGYDILKQITEMPMISEGARWHHERIDGRGYPDGITGKNIPEIARIIAVADAYDAMTSNRSYRKALPQNVAREQIEKNKGTQFDPEIADIMLQLIDEDTEYSMRE